MGRYLDPKNDIPFKRIFGENPKLLKSFLNALMPFKRKQYIVSLEYLPNELVPENPLKKDSIVDVRCKDNYDRQFIVEMQMYWNTSFSNRMVFNASKAYVRQLDISENYNLLQPVYALGIINDVFDETNTDYYHHYKTINCNNSKDIIKGLEFVMVELPKFTPTTIAEKKMAVLWLRFLKEIKDNMYDDPAQELIKNRYIREAIRLCEVGKYDDAHLAAYDRHWDAIRRESAALESNLNKGIELGKVEGRELGKVEEREKTVVKSFKNGISIDVISSITDLSEDEIKSILKEHELMK